MGYLGIIVFLGLVTLFASFFTVKQETAAILSVSSFLAETIAPSFSYISA